jgi:hypothetical protein
LLIALAFLLTRRLARLSTQPVWFSSRALSAEFVAGNLRDIRFDGAEVIRAIGYIVRDKDWGTYAPVLSNFETRHDAGSFQVSYDARRLAADRAALTFSATIAGCADGSLRFNVAATPAGDFQTNRCDFCVLHPIVGVAGSLVVIEHVEDSLERTLLPDLLDPWEPFKSMRAITHRVCPRLQATCRLEGDAFEMEDQRNRSDASYKTYVRPLELPWPYRLADGELLSNRFRWPSTALRRRSRRQRQAPRLQWRLARRSGRCRPSASSWRPRKRAPSSRKANGSWKSVHKFWPAFGPTVGHRSEALAGFAAIAALTKAEITLECVVPCRDEVGVELTAVAAMTERVGLRLDAVAVSPSVDRQSTPPGSAWPACPPLEHVYAAARSAFPGLRLGGGSFSYFTELNRNRPPVDLLDFVTHATCPIVHAADDRSVMQTLEALPFIARSARAFIGNEKP